MTLKLINHNCNIIHKSGSPSENENENEAIEAIMSKYLNEKLVEYYSINFLSLFNNVLNIYFYI